jgi:hypothetical protein
VLWATSDNGKTWYDTAGRTNGRHTTFALLSDGTTILGMGGKNTDIDGYMPKSISANGGRTYEYSKTPFCKQGSNQRPSVLRLKSSRLFFAADFQHISGDQPEAISQRGSFVALSEDDGETWRTKKLIGTQQHEDPQRHKGANTIGYSAARQAPNGLIHLITTMNRPCLHLEMNEAWILSESTPEKSDEELMKPSASTITQLKQYREQYPDGKVKATWSGGVADDGTYLLHGIETWYYENGQKQRQANYDFGRKAGIETYWSQDGTELWKWRHKHDGSGVWMQFWPNGRKKAESTWRNLKCEGTATRYDTDGQVISTMTFVNGRKPD